MTYIFSLLLAIAIGAVLGVVLKDTFVKKDEFKKLKDKVDELMVERKEREDEQTSITKFMDDVIFPQLEEIENIVVRKKRTPKKVVKKTTKKK